MKDGGRHNDEGISLKPNLVEIMDISAECVVDGYLIEVGKFYHDKSQARSNSVSRMCLGF